MRLTAAQAEERILYEDDALIVFDKPAGIAVETARVTEPDLMGILRARQWRAAGGAEGAEIFPVHRLDQPVRGVMVFAKTKEAAASLSEQLTDGRMKKVYRAQVDGLIPKDEDTLTDYLVKDPKTNLSRVVPKGGMGKDRPKRAVLRYRKVGEHEVEVELETGRHHQIRVQLAHAGMPITGDQKYGKPVSGKTMLALTAVRLAFSHPVTGKKMQFALPDIEERALNQI